MYDIYLLEELKSFSNAAVASGTNDIQIDNNKIIIKNITRKNIAIGQKIVIAGYSYIIDKIVYNDLYRYYSFTVQNENYNLLYTATAWAIYPFTTTSNSFKLDCTNLDLNITYQVSDYTDISSRKDSVTNAFQLKGTTTNNAAFGNIFHLNKHTDVSIANRLAFNYTPLRPVNCLIYENGKLVINGTMLITGITADVNDNIVYNCSVTGRVSEFTSKLSDALLTDLDLKDLEHVYNTSAIINSWKGLVSNPTYSIGNSSYQVKDPVTGAVSTKSAEYGSGYFYPCIDYGNKFKQNAYNQSFTDFKIQNYRPALYVKEYFNRIFNQIGYSYEVKGSPDLLNKFNRLFVPNNQDGLYGLQVGIQGRLACSGVSGFITSTPYGNGYAPTGYNPTRYILNASSNDYRMCYAIPLPILNNTNLISLSSSAYPNPVPFSSGIYDFTAPLNQRQNNLIRINRNFSSSCRVQVDGTMRQQTSADNGKLFYVQLVRRGSDIFQDTTDAFADFEVIAEQSFTYQYNVTMQFVADIVVGDRAWNLDDILQVRILRVEDTHNVICNITSASIQFAKDANSLSNVEIQSGDNITPAAPADVKQLDFILSVAKHFNFIVYNDKTDAKHIIFETYNDYYGLTEGTNAKATALDWTKKIAKGFTKKSNITIPKNYLFTQKDDSDYLNSKYKSDTGEIYGQLKFTDSLGFTDTKKVESIFSPSIVATIPGQDKTMPYLTKDEISLAGKNTMKSNIRLMYYNGVHCCKGYNISKDNPIYFPNFPTIWLISPILSNLKFYPLVSNYLYDESSDTSHSPMTGSNPSALIPKGDINFYFPNEYFFVVNNNYYKVINAYDYYRNQITELTDSNMFILECNAYLNDVDISNLNLKVPIYVDFGSMGAVYFKLINVDYNGSGNVSKITLQRVVF